MKREKQFFGTPILEFFKKETVLSIAMLLAVLSSFFVHPDAKYMDYIDIRTLVILFCLMAVVAGLQNLGLFEWFAWKLLGRVRKRSQLFLALVLQCFFFSMLITNDVALLTFIPFTITVLKMFGEKERKFLIPLAAMETIAANLGSMLTPIGNPQNLYLFGLSSLSIREFLALMLPYSLEALLLLIVWCVFAGRGADDLSMKTRQNQNTIGNRKLLFAYLLLFVGSLFTVLHVIPYPVTLGIILLWLILCDRRVLHQVDYALLLTFIGFFVFVGNMGRIPAFRQFLESVVADHEVLTGILSSQVISNVPAALLLSGFTTDIPGLIVGTNLGGLGTLIASMASLISFKFIGREDKKKRLPYLIWFTVANVIFLAVLAASSAVRLW